jgi:parallel beta-helix repeat protein
VAVIREGGTPRRALAAGIAVALFVWVYVPAASAATIDVTPGPNAINNAIAQAHAGDVLRIHDGNYRRAVIVDKRLTLRGVGGRPLIDARCNQRIAIKVEANGVNFDHLKVVGAADTPQGPFPSELDVTGARTGVVHDVVVHDTCGGPEEGAEYGINIANTGAVEVSDNRATGGFSDAGIYVGFINDTDGKPLRVVRNDTYLNHQGIIIEDVRNQGIVQVANNNVHHNIGAGVEGSKTGIFIHRSSRVRVRGNTVRSNGEFGVNIDSASDHNRLIDNTITGNPVDLNNQGTANCGSGNTIGTRTGNPLIACP